jgi:hypothetical protein
LIRVFLEDQCQGKDKENDEKEECVVLADKYQKVTHRLLIE